MEFCDGPTLDDLVRRGPMKAADVVRLLSQLCGALGEAHAAGLVHRDVKPGNVIVYDRGGEKTVAKLLDFGLVTAGVDDSAGVAGTPAFMSPERADGRPATAASDLYALGAVGFFLLTGRPPFVKATVGDTLAAHRGEAPAFPDGAGVPAGLAAVVLRCLNKDPAARYPDAASLREALRRASPDSTRDAGSE